MTPPAPDQVTKLLEAASRGEMDAAERLFPLVYEELRDLARGYLRRERAGHTLQATALVHEAWMNLVGQTEATYRDRGHFFAIAATAMRRILVNHAMARKTAKRGGEARRGAVEVEEIAAEFEHRAIDLVALDEAMQRLEVMDADQARLVELRFFAGLSIDETAEVLDRSRRSVLRDWSVARAWLRAEIEGLR